MNALKIPQSEWVDKEVIRKNRELWPYEVSFCRQDFWYFVLRWVYTKDANSIPTRRLFPDKEYLRFVFDIIEANKKVAIRKSRRMIMTWLNSARLVWKCLFNADQSFALQSKKAKDSEGLLGKRTRDFITFILEELDPLFFAELGVPTILTDVIAFANGSWVRAIPQGPEQLKQWTLSEWAADEAAKHDFLNEALGASLPTLEGGGRALLWSSVKPGDFDELCCDMIGGEGERPEIEVIPEKLLGCEEHLGLQVHKNPWNGFVVITLHYSADPLKDPCTPEGKAWYDKARIGISDEQWNQEYELDARAKAASLIIYNFVKGIHIRPFNIEKSWTFYHVLDIGIDAPTAGIWFGVDRMENMYVFEEYYHRNRTIEQNAMALCAMEDFLVERYKISLPVLNIIDPAAFKRDYNGSCPAFDYARPGSFQRVYTSGNNDLHIGIEKLREYFQNTIDKKSPAIYFLPHLSKVFFELRNWIMNDTTHKPRERHDHLMACLRYAVMCPPIYIERGVSPRYIMIRNSLTGTPEYVEMERGLGNPYAREKDD